ncbi:MAG: ATP-binding protein, partial [Pseudomonadota bacterium]
AEVLAGQSSYDLIGRGIVQAFPLAIDDAASIEHPVLNVLSGARFADISREFKFAHGEHERYVEVTVAPINSGEGALLGAVMTMRDVSLRRDNERALRSAYAELDRRVAERTAALEQANAALNESLQQRKRIEIEREQLLAIEQRLRRDAERANRAKDEFLAIVSHELRSPLNALRGWGFLLSSAKTPDASVIERATAAIKRNVDHQVRLIDDLLDTSRILSGKLNIERQPVNLVEVVQTALEVVRPAAVNKRITLDFHAPAPELMLEGDGARLQQIAVNLLANAIKFTPEEGRVKAVLEAKQSIARLAVIDTGAGIEPEFLPRVFDRFSQADTSTTRRHGGLGIGLALVRYLTEMHNGTVYAHSEGVGKGSTFIVELPLSSAVQPGVSVAVHATPYAARLEGHVVWALDDDPDAREVIHLTLQQAGARVRSVTTGAELLTMLEACLPEERPDVLLLDLGMPEEDGFMVLSRIRTLESLKNTDSQPGIPAIAVSAFTEISLERIIERGFSDFVSKPFNPNELIASIVHVTRFAAPETELQGSVAALLPEPGAR